MRKISVIFFLLIFCFNTVFAFDPYADEEPETRSRAKLYYGIAMTIIGGLLAYDGFSQEEIDISKPSVDYSAVIHASASQNESVQRYELRSGIALTTDMPDDTDTFQRNYIRNTGNVDIYNLKVYTRYASKTYGEYMNVFIDGGQTDDYRLAKFQPDNTSLDVNKEIPWSDYCEASTVGTTPPMFNDEGNKIEEEALELVDVKITYDYKKIYKKENKSDIEGVVGLMFATAGIYFIVDYFVDLHKFNQYVKKHDISFRFAHANTDEYKLLFQKRL